MSLAGRLSPAGRVLLDAVLPARCMSCGTILGNSGALCAPCWREIRFLGDPACACCGYPFEYAVPDRTLCAACTREPPAYDRARAVFAYDDNSRSLILGFKHADRLHDAPAFGQWLARTGASLASDADLIVPVPLHRWRLFFRRYNQAGLLAQALSRETGVPAAVDLLTRYRNTPPQGRMSRTARRRNIRGAIRLRDKPGRTLADAHIILVDDVLTTGATAEECARVLKGAGAGRVDVLTLARVVRPRV